MSAGRLLLLAGAACSLASHASGQGENGYLRGRGGWLFGFSYQEADFEETIGQGMGSVLSVDRKLISVYVDVGLTDALDLVVQPIYQRAEFRALEILPPEENLTDLQVYAKWRVWKQALGPGELHFLLAPGLQTDLQDYETEGFLSLGAGQTDWRARSITHYQARTGAWFAAIEAGYDFRSGAPPDDLVVRTQVGLNVGGLLTLQPFYDVFDARGGDDGVDAVGNPAAAGRDYDVWGLKLFAKLDRHVGIWGGYFELDDDRPSGVVPGFGFGLVVSG